ncbi:MAG: ATP-binding protein [Clostridia bacterium]|nr:ATP-binding protein [Clostridia bacterium]
MVKNLEKRKKRSIWDAVVSKNDVFLPDYINLHNPKYIEMDGLYSAGLMVVNYAGKQEIGWMLRLLELNFDADISMFYEKLEFHRVIRDLTYYIGNIHTAIQTVSRNQQDIDLMETSCEDAKYIRREMQVNKEDLYHLCMYISVSAETVELLNFNLEKLEGICAAMGLATRRTVFRQKELFETMLPIAENPAELKSAAVRNVLTEGLSSTYPFVSSELYDEDGVLIGTNNHNHSLIVVDRFNSMLYKNANMCVLGTSGAGKSFLVKLMLLRNRYLGIQQFVIDPDSEYRSVCESLDGTFLEISPSSRTYINVMDIRESEKVDSEPKGYLMEKLARLKTFFSLILKELSEEEERVLEENLIACYKKFGITFEDESLFLESGETLRLKPKFRDLKDMPVLGDLYNVLLEDKRAEGLAIRLKPFISGAYSYFNHHTNVNFGNKLIVADISKTDTNKMAASMYAVIELFWDKIQANRGEKKIIYLDELWRLIGSSGNQYTAEFVYKIFKTIRKYGGAATAITQDVSDFFDLENGKYGKAIINNSALKFVLQLEEEDIGILKNVLKLSEEEEFKIRNFARGNCLFYAGKNHVETKIQAYDYEYDLITTDRADLERIGK